MMSGYKADTRVYLEWTFNQNRYFTQKNDIFIKAALKCPLGRH